MIVPDTLADCRRQLDAADTLDTLLAVVRGAGRRLSAADGVTVVLREDDKCFYADEDSIAPLWKGQRFPMQECISGWAMLRHAIAIVPDITVDARIPQAAYRPTYVRSLVMVPISRPHPHRAAVGAIGAYWARVHTATGSEVAALQELAEMAAEALHRIGLDDAPWAPNFAQRAAEPTDVPA